MTLIDKMRDATKMLHQELDHSLVPYIESIQSKEDYAALLLLFYGFFKPVYDNIDAYLETDSLPDYRTRRKPEWILNDLEHLEVNYSVEFCKRLPPVTDNVSAFGSLYVLEGSTLGGMIIKKMIGDKLHIHKGLSFFSGYGKQTRGQWNVFIQALNNVNNSEAEEVTLIESAAATFVLFKDWLQDCRLKCLRTANN